MGQQYFSNVEVWNADGVQSKVDVLVADGKIESIDAHNPSREVREDADVYGTPSDEAATQALIPLGVDLQVHLRIPGQDHKETADTGLKAARKGAYGALLTMPNTQPVIDTPEVLKSAMGQTAAWEKLWGVKVLWSVAMTKGQKGAEVVDAVALKEAGAVALTDDGIGVAKDEVMDQVFAAAAKAKLPCLQHAEVPGHGAALAAGPVQQSLGLKAYPADAEWKMVKRDIDLLKKHPSVRYHVLHVSCVRTVQLVTEARKRGQKVTCEVTPHHLFYSSADIMPGKTSFKMNPPLRSPEDKKFLQEALKSGAIQFVATDHAPHESTLKGPDFNASAFGTTGLESSLRVLLSLYQSGIIGPEKLVEVFSTAPAQFYGLEKEGFGSLKVGSPFRAALIEPKAAPRVFEEKELSSLSHNNCFVGAQLGGRILETFV